ncbi:MULTISPECIES: hypothetical protein [unclassified Streptomyces]|uniref:hypothetical protein n=1 Tax=unclassified Streptomyces TaxID=2593676 RepID=UPI00093A0B7F|nr:hypothetical protein [Streptomyces sp. TSRI0281]OKI34931.1 hypothetical protein A6A29_15990 [Streptomyces sp. TSRI0281]
MRLLARTAVNTLCALSVLSLAACGTGAVDSADSAAPKATGPFADMSGPEVTNKALSTTKKAKSLRISVDLRSTDGPVKADFATSRTGECIGTMSIGPAGTMEIIKTGDTVYTKFDEAMLREQSKGEPEADVDAAVKLLAGRWMESKATDADTKDSIEFCDLDGILKGFEANDTAARKAGGATVAGKPALRLTEKDGKETYTVLVAAEGAPYLLRVTSKGGEEPTTMNLSAFDEPVVAKKPAAKDIVDLDRPAG